LHHDFGPAYDGFDLFAFADNGTVFSTHPKSTTLNSAGFGFNVRPGPVTFSAVAGFPLRTVLPAQKKPDPLRAGLGSPVTASAPTAKKEGGFAHLRKSSFNNDDL